MKLAVRAFDEDIFASSRWSRVVLHGTFVAFRFRLEVEGEVTETVRVANLRTGTHRAIRYVPPLRVLAVSATGGVGFLSGDGLWAVDGGGQRRLADASVDPDSVSIAGSTLRWAGGQALLAGGVSCEPRLGTTLAWDDVGRVYERAPRPTPAAGDARATPRADPPAPGRELWGCTWLRSLPVRLTAAPHANVRLVGRFAAWSELGAVVVHDLLDGREIRPAAGEVREVAVGGDGAVAWVEPGRILGTRGLEARELAAADADPGSLAVRGGFASWREGGAVRSAPIPR